MVKIISQTLWQRYIYYNSCKIKNIWFYQVKEKYLKKIEFVDLFGHNRK